jgi:hypothetical protein
MASHALLAGVQAPRHHHSAAAAAAAQHKGRSVGSTLSEAPQYCIVTLQDAFLAAANHLSAELRPSSILHIDGTI